MKAEGSAQDSDAQYVRESCMQTEQVGLVELITPEVLFTLPIHELLRFRLCRLAALNFQKLLQSLVPEMCRN